MEERTTVHAVFPEGRVVQTTFPVWMLPLPGDLVTIPGELGEDGGFLPLRVTARLMQPEPIPGQPRITLFVEVAVEPSSRPPLTVVR